MEYIYKTKFDIIYTIEVSTVKHMTKIFVVLAVLLFIIGYYLQATGNESSGIKFLLAAIMFMICAFISRNNDRRNRK